MAAIDFDDPPDGLPSRIRTKIQVNPDSGCWAWTGCIAPTGYGQIKIGGRAGRAQYAHRVVYTLLRGGIAAGLQVDHLCRNRACVNPDHLEPVPQRENIRRGISSAAAGMTAQADGLCLAGHVLAAVGVVQNGAGRAPRCAECNRLRSQARRRSSS